VTNSTKVGVLLWVFVALAVLVSFVFIPHGPLWLGPLGLLVSIGLVVYVRKITK